MRVIGEYCNWAGIQGSVILDQNGNLFGTTFGGGLYGYGTLFKLTYTPESGWVETVLYSFSRPILLRT